MGTINYMTSSYIPMGLKPQDISDFEDENGNIDYDLLEMDYEKEKKMVTAAILATIIGVGCTVCIVTLYALHRLTGGKMSLKKWIHLNFDF